MIRVFLLAIVISALTSSVGANASEGTSFAGDLALCLSDCESQVSIELRSAPVPVGQPVQSDHGCADCGSHHPATGAYGALTQPAVTARAFLPSRPEAIHSAKTQRFDRPPIHG